MKKQVLALVLGLAVAVAAAPTAFAALSNNEKAEVDKLEAEIAKLRKQVVQKYVDSGEITAEQGKAIQQRIEAAQQNRALNGVPFGGGMGLGGCGGPGAGQGGCGGGGCGAAGTAPTTPAPTPQSL